MIVKIQCLRLMRIFKATSISNVSLWWHHNGYDGVSNHQPHHSLLNRLFGYWLKKTSKLCVTGLCAGNSPGTVEFPAQMASNAENVSIWWRHHVFQDIGLLSPYTTVTLATWILLSIYYKKKTYLINWTMTSHQRHGVSNHWQLDCSFKSLNNNEIQQSSA